MIATAGPAGALIEQELVVHAYAPLLGARAARAADQVRLLWHRGCDLLGLDEPIPRLPGVLPDELAPADAGREPAPVLAARQDRAATFQLIARRHHDVVSLSVLFATPVNRDRSGPSLAPNWSRFTRWWHELSADATDAMLAVVRIYQALATTDGSVGELVSPVRAALPAMGTDAGWGERGRLTERGLVEFDIASRGARADRTMVVIARVEDAATLGAYTWSRGNPDQPPLSRYLLPAAKLRHQARVLGGGGLAGLDHRVRRRTTALRAALSRGDRVDWPRARSELDRDLAELALTRADLIGMRHAVTIAADDLGASGVEPLDEDERLAGWLRRRLVDDHAELAGREEQVRAVLDLVPAGPATASAGSTTGRRSALVPAPDPTLRSGSQTRFGFAVDVVGYCLRPAAGRADALRRLTVLVDDILQGVGVSGAQVDPQPLTGGAIVFLPPEVTSERGLATVLRRWPDRLARDNSAAPDRLRLRVAAVVGPVSVTALGPGNDTVAEAGRLLGCRVLRGAVGPHRDIDLAVVISDALHFVTVAQGYPEFAGYRFEPAFVEEETAGRPIWLWMTDADHPGPA